MATPNGSLADVGDSSYTVPQMHEGQITATVRIVRDLLADQFPKWSELELTAIPGGTDHALFRLGPALLARFPLTSTRGQPLVDATWLPQVAPYLHLQVPVPVGLGRPGHGYPWHWLVVPWIDGSPSRADVAQRVDMARDLARFVRALHAAPAHGGPPKRPLERGCALEHLDSRTLSLIQELSDEIDTPRVRRTWEAIISAEPWAGPPVWLHTDLGPDNLIMRDDRLVGVIDFLLGVGDPAPDLLPAWLVFSGDARDVYLDELGYDPETRRRALAWLLLPALEGLSYFRNSRPDFVQRSRHHLELALEAMQT